MAFQTLSTYLNDYLRRVPWGKNVEAARLEAVLRTFMAEKTSAAMASECRIERWDGSLLVIGVPHPAVAEALRSAERQLRVVFGERGCVVGRIQYRVSSRPG